MPHNATSATEEFRHHDSEKCPVGFPVMNKGDTCGNRSAKIKVSTGKLKSIIERLTRYDPQVGPPNSTAKRIHLGFGRYEYPGRTPLVIRMPKEAKAKIDALVKRLKTEVLPSKNLALEEQTEKTDIDRKQQHCSKEDLKRIILKFSEFDFKRSPVESTRERQLLGFNRYDYYHGPSYTASEKKVSPDELQVIIDRLTKYDINQGPAGSRGHEKLK
ncbi:hypothetical protein D915_001038 [Fasciola hepatica]|uniref:Uncharacterized protein n=1 Tax=Fasciola hepatica TaxID=6192 RepID=A0A4E0S2Z4_FASHE|nr:hypothetical protein D915_001038 [Fasciola hepatica]